jgi:hypothetical protein
MLGVLIHCWVLLVGVSGGGKMYSGSSIIIKIYPALSLAIGGRDGMDGGGGHWMTCSINSTPHPSWLSGLLGALRGRFGWGKVSLGAIILINFHPVFHLHIWG